MMLALKGSSSNRQEPSFQHDPRSRAHLKEAVDRMSFPKYCNLILKKTDASGPEQPE